MDVPIPKNIPSFRRSGRSHILMNVILLIAVAALLIFIISLVRIKLLQNWYGLSSFKMLKVLAIPWYRAMPWRKSARSIRSKNRFS